MTPAELDAENLMLHRALASTKLELHQITLQWRSMRDIVNSRMTWREVPTTSPPCKDEAPEAVDDYLEFGCTLPCGCQISHRVAHVFGAGDFLDSSTQMLRYWLQSRSDRHQCALVPEDNASDVAPRSPG